MINAIGRLIGGAIRAVCLAISWVLWMALAIAVIAGVIAIGAALGPMWIIVILLLLIWLK